MALEWSDWSSDTGVAALQSVGAASPTAGLDARERHKLAERERRKSMRELCGSSSPSAFAPEPSSSVSIRVRGDRVNVSLTDTKVTTQSLLLSAVLDELEGHNLELVRSTHCRDGSKVLHHSESKVIVGSACNSYLNTERSHIEQEKERKRREKEERTLVFTRTGFFLLEPVGSLNRLLMTRIATWRNVAIYFGHVIDNND